jgi:hypothetical protein
MLAIINTNISISTHSVSNSVNYSVCELVIVLTTLGAVSPKINLAIREKGISLVQFFATIKNQFGVPAIT